MQSRCVCSSRRPSVSSSLTCHPAPYRSALSTSTPTCRPTAAARAARSPSRSTRRRRHPHLPTRTRSHGRSSPARRRPAHALRLALVPRRRVGKMSTAPRASTSCKRRSRSASAALDLVLSDLCVPQLTLVPRQVRPRHAHRLALRPRHARQRREQLGRDDRRAGEPRSHQVRPCLPAP